MNRNLLLVPVALACILPFQAEASSNGRSVGATAVCSSCHGGASTAVTTTIAGPTTLLPGATGTYTTTLTGTQLAGAGFNVSLAGLAGATIGKIASETDTQLVNFRSGAPSTAQQLTHVDAYGGNLGDWSYSFTLTAPATPGTIDIRSVMLAYDNSGDESGDLWANKTFSVTVAPAAAVPEASTTLQLGAGLASLAFVGWRRRSSKNS
jgi:mono/diheme cytochrome c family protein